MWVLYSSKIIEALNKTSGFLSERRVFLYSLALMIITSTLLVKVYVQAARMGEKPGADFVQFYTAAVLTRVSPEKVYDADAQIVLQRQFSPARLEGIHWPYLHAPFFTILLIPLSFFSYTVAYWIWVTTTVLLYFLSIIILWKCCQPKQPPLGLALAIGGAAPVLYWLTTTGHSTAIALFFWTVGFYLLKRQRVLCSGFIFAFLSYRAQYLIALLPLLIFRRIGRAIVGIAAGLFLLIVIGGVVFSFDSYLKYIDAITNFSHRIATQAQPLSFYVTLYGFFRPLLPQAWAVTCTIATALLLVYWLLQTWRVAVPLRSNGFDLQYAMLVTTTLLLMHHGFVYDLLLLTIPALLMYPHRALFPPYYKILLALIYITPYLLLLFRSKLRMNPVQPLLFWLCFELYRANLKLRPHQVAA